MGVDTSAKVKPSSTRKSAPKAASKPAAKATSSHPSWKDMIKECIEANHDEIRSGVSRATIKKFAEDQYRLEMNAMQVSQLNRAISHGADTGMFALPKGPSGKVKLAPKIKSNPAKENEKPIAVKKAVVKDVVKPVKKAPVKKAAAPMKKAAAPKKAVSPKKAPAAAPIKKKAVAKPTKPVKKTSSAVLEKKKAAVKASKVKAVRKPLSKTRSRKVVA